MASKESSSLAAAERIKQAAMKASKGLSRAQAERAAAAAARNVNAYGQKEEGPSRWQERKEAKRQMYLSSTEQAVKLGVRTQKGAAANPGNQMCQKCYKTGHWTFECKNERVYVSRPSRTQQLKNPKLKMRHLDASELPDGLDPRAAEREEVRQKEVKRNEKKNKKRKRAAETTSESDTETDSSSEFDADDSSSESDSYDSASETTESDSSDSASETESKTDSEEKRKQREKSRRKYSSEESESDGESDSEEESSSSKYSESESELSGSESESESEDRERDRRRLKHKDGKKLSTKDVRVCSKRGKDKKRQVSRNEGEDEQRDARVAREKDSRSARSRNGHKGRNTDVEKNGRDNKEVKAGGRGGVPLRSETGRGKKYSSSGYSSDGEEADQRRDNGRDRQKKRAETGRDRQDDRHRFIDGEDGRDKSYKSSGR